MKLPNGYGTVKELQGNRRRPFMACEGVTGKQAPLGYAATKEEALNILARFHDSPWDIDTAKITLQQLYTRWLERRAPRILGDSNYKALKSAYRHIAKIGPMKYKDIKAVHMQDCIDTCGREYSTQGAIKNLWRYLDEYAFELDIIGKQYHTLLKVDATPETTRGVFSEPEIAKLWQHAGEPWVDSVLFLIYTGYRVDEMLQLTRDKIDIDEWILYGGNKTKAGRHKVVPVHSKIKSIVEGKYNASETGLLFEKEGKAVSYYVYYSLFSKLMAKMGMRHTIHETRHTFRSRLDTAGANQVCIDRMMGHKSEGTGKSVYTHKDIEELRRNIELVTN